MSLVVLWLISFAAFGCWFNVACLRTKINKSQTEAEGNSVRCYYLHCSPIIMSRQTFPKQSLADYCLSCPGLQVSFDSLFKATSLFLRCINRCNVLAGHLAHTRPGLLSFACINSCNMLAGTFCSFLQLVEITQPWTRPYCFPLIASTRALWHKQSTGAQTAVFVLAGHFQHTGQGRAAGGADHWAAVQWSCWQVSGWPLCDWHLPQVPIRGQDVAFTLFLTCPTQLVELFLLTFLPVCPTRVVVVLFLLTLLPVLFPHLSHWPQMPAQDKCVPATFFCCASTLLLDLLHSLFAYSSYLLCSLFFLVFFMPKHVV